MISGSMPLWRQSADMILLERVRLPEPFQNLGLKTSPQDGHGSHGNRGGTNEGLCLQSKWSCVALRPQATCNEGLHMCRAGRFVTSCSHVCRVQRPYERQTHQCDTANILPATEYGIGDEEGVIGHESADSTRLPAASKPHHRLALLHSHLHKDRPFHSSAICRRAPCVSQNVMAKTIDSCGELRAGVEGRRSPSSELRWLVQRERKEGDADQRTNPGFSRMN